MGEVAGPHRRTPALGARLDADIDLDGDFASLHVARHRGLVIALAGLAALGDLDAADAEAEAVAVDALAGLADSHDDAAPIGVTAGDRGLDQGRIGDGHGDGVSRDVIMDS